MKWNKNFLTLQQAEEQGFGKVVSIKAQINRGVLKAVKIGNVWVVHRKDLNDMVIRRKEWLNKRNIKNIIATQERIESEYNKYPSMKNV